jgi:hypothetical protein
MTSHCAGDTSMFSIARSFILATICAFALPAMACVGSGPSFYQRILPMLDTGSVPAVFYLNFTGDLDDLNRLVAGAVVTAQSGKVDVYSTRQQAIEGASPHTSFVLEVNKRSEMLSQVYDLRANRELDIRISKDCTPRNS